MSSKNYEIVWWGFITVWHLAPLEPTSESVFGVTCLWQNICKDNFRADVFSWIVASKSLVHHGQLHPIWIHDWAKWWQRHRSVAAHIRVDGNQVRGRRSQEQDNHPKTVLPTSLTRSFHNIFRPFQTSACSWNQIFKTLSTCVCIFFKPWLFLKWEHWPWESQWLP